MSQKLSYASKHISPLHNAAMAPSQLGSQPCPFINKRLIYVVRALSWGSKDKSI